MVNGITCIRNNWDKKIITGTFSKNANSLPHAKLTRVRKGLAQGIFISNKLLRRFFCLLNFEIHHNRYRLYLSCRYLIGTNLPGRQLGGRGCVTKLPGLWVSTSSAGVIIVKSTTLSRSDSRRVGEDPFVFSQYSLPCLASSPLP